MMDCLVLRDGVSDISTIFMGAQSVLSGSFNGTAKFWRLPTDCYDSRSVIADLVLHHDSQPTTISSVFLSSSEGAGFTGCRNGIVKVWDISKRHELQMLSPTSVVDSGLVCGLTDSPGSTSIFWGQNNCVKTWDLRLKTGFEVSKTNEVITDISVSRKKCYIAAGTQNGEVNIWDIRKCGMTSPLTTVKLQEYVRLVSFDTINDILAIADETGKGALRYIRRGEQTVSLLGSTISSVAFSKSSDCVYFGLEGAIAQVKTDDSFIPTFWRDSLVGCGHVIAMRNIKPELLRLATTSSSSVIIKEIDMSVSDQNFRKYDANKMDCDTSEAGENTKTEVEVMKYQKSWRYTGKSWDYKTLDLELGLTFETRRDAKTFLDLYVKKNCCKMIISSGGTGESSVTRQVLY